MTANPLRQRLDAPDGIAARLRELRAQAGITGERLAELAGWPPSKVSKIERAKQVPTSEDIDTWADLCGHPEVADKLKDQLEALQAWHRSWKSRLRTGGTAAVQTTFTTLASEATRIRNFEQVTVPGSLQTPEYARAVFMSLADFQGRAHDINDIDNSVANRMERQRFLYETGRQWEFILDESILLRPVHGVDITVAQLDRLQSAIGLSNVSFGILPLGRPLTIIPQNRFVLYDDIAFVETCVGETQHEGDEAAVYHKVMDRLWDNAVTGNRARQIISAAIDSLREVPQ